MEHLLVLALTVSAFSFTVAKTPVFQWLRDWVSEKNEKAGEGISCPYCLGHYAAAIAVLLFQVRPVPMPIPYFNWFLELALSWLAVTCLAGILSGVLAHFYPFRNLPQVRKL